MNYHTIVKKMSINMKEVKVAERNLYLLLDPQVMIGLACSMPML